MDRSAFLHLNKSYPLQTVKHQSENDNSSSTNDLIRYYLLIHKVLYVLKILKNLTIISIKW